jgi:hypothetical protein
VAMTRRRQIADAAREAGLGAVVRVHRGHVPIAEGVLGKLATAMFIAAALAGWGATALRSADSTAWQWPLLAWCAAAATAYLWVHLGPVRGGRRWVGVAECGLVVWTNGHARARTWDEVTSADTRQICDSGEVRAAVNRRGPAGAWSPRRSIEVTATVVTTAAAIWFTLVPIALTVALGAQPTALAQFTRMCHGGGPFGRGAPYAGPAPHPTVVYTETDRLDPYRDDPDPEPGAVQLVGCVRADGVAPATPVDCEYAGGSTRKVLQGRYRLDVYEARTGRVAASFAFEGYQPGCSPVITESAGTGPTSSTYTSAYDARNYQTQLRALVNSPPQP